MTPKTKVDTPSAKHKHAESGCIDTTRTYKSYSIEKKNGTSFRNKINVNEGKEGMQKNKNKNKVGADYNTGDDGSAREIIPTAEGGGPRYCRIL